MVVGVHSQELLVDLVRDPGTTHPVRGIPSVHIPLCSRVWRQCNGNCNMCSSL